MSLTRILAEIAVETDSREITDSAREACKKLILDTVGVSIAAWNAPGIRELFEQIDEWGGDEESTVLVYGSKVPAPNAAFVNSAMAHALDYDDLHDPSALHIMSIVMPTVLAVAEMTDATGRGLLDGIILGVETACRLGMPYNRLRKGPQGRGFLPSSVIGGFGATAAACRLLGYSVDQTVNALGINYAQASGNRQALFDRTLTKRLQPAFAARNAIWSAALAGQGLTGPENAAEGDAGLFRVYINVAPPSEEEIRRSRGFFEIERNTIKRFTSCGLAHPVTQAALDLAKQYDLRKDDLKQVTIYIHGGPDGENLVGRPFEIGDTPQVNAQFSAAYGVAVALLRRRAGLAEFTDQQVRKDTEVAELARRIRIVANRDEPGGYVRIEDDFPPHVDKPHTVVVTTRDGRELSKTYTIREILSPKAMTMADTIAKFRGCAEFSGICPADKAEAIISSIQQLEKLDHASDFVAHCECEP